MPAIKEFPVNSLEEWSLFQQALLRTAHAYIFVFDLNTPSTFYYVKSKYKPKMKKYRESKFNTSVPPPLSQLLVNK